MGTFETGIEDLSTQGVQDVVYLGHRRCPNPECRAHVFTVVAADGSLKTSYPPETIDFDSSKLPPEIVQTLEEAIICHAANCFRASALMVRRTLEELCEDQKTTGKNLKERLQTLSGKIAIATRLVDGLDDLRLLGNDAAHVELKDFDAVGEEEAGLAIEIVKEVLKGVYQYDDLINRLAARKQHKP